MSFIKNVFLFAGAAVVFAAFGGSKKATVASNEPLKTYETLKDKDGGKMLRGIVTEEQITQDTAFHWYADNLKFYKPNPTTVDQLKEKKDSISLVIFGGTWCHDTQNILPKYFSVLDAAGFPKDKVTLIIVDRDKTTIGNLQKPFNITNVPTLIVMKGGKEQGRIIEYGTSGLADKELGEMLQAMK
jgi:thiol-disulfide isomerase/thioredoxin